LENIVPNPQEGGDINEAPDGPIDIRIAEGPTDPSNRYERIEGPVAELNKARAELAAAQGKTADLETAV
jgi:hypothetical protein